ncbi:MAG: outer membrane lipoprotein-sorting protein [Bacteroidota bacterium]
MKTIKLFLIVGLSSITFQSFAQNADEILTKYFNTVGGVEKWNALNGVKINMTANQQGMEIPVEMVQLKGGKTYIKINFQGKEITQLASDGNTMWSTNFMTMKAEKLDSEATENAKLSNADFPDPFLDYKSKGYSVEYVGKETKDGAECFKLKLTKKPVMVSGVKADDVTYYYFDTENYLPIVTETEIKQGPMKGQKSTSKMSDYQEVEGLYFPYAMNMFGSDVKVTKITLNPVIEDKAFAFPIQ